MDETELLENREPMQRLSHKAKLIKDTTMTFAFLEQKKMVLSKQMLRFSRKTLYKDFKKGIKLINKKIPVFIELPEYEKKGEGMYSKVFETELNENEIIEVTPPVVQGEHSILNN